MATATGKTGLEPSPAKLKKLKLANNSRAYSIGDKDSDDSEFFDVPIKKRSPSIANAKQESVTPIASGSSSNAIKAEDAGYDNNIIVIDDSSDSATEGRSVTSHQARDEFDNVSKLSISSPGQKNRPHQAQYGSIVDDEMPPPSRAEQPSSSRQERTGKDGSPSNAIRRHASAPARSIQKGSSAYDQVEQAVQAPTDQNRSAPEISGIKRYRIATAGASASKRRLVSKGAMRGPGGQ